MLNLTRRFPWLVALGALALYGATLSHGVTIHSLALTAKVAGWDWMPMVGQPILWLLTLPLRLLPAAGVPAGLNFLSAACAALTLGLLARTVQLLPWDQPLEKESPWVSAVPVLLACSACGLEYSFWREATAATGEMLDLLLLATPIWLLLEYRVRRTSRWLAAAAFAWGLGMTENWVMLLALPLFVGGVIWLEGFLFWQWKSVRRLAVLILLGFSFYALLPLANGLSPHSPWSLGQAWLVSLKQTKGTVMLLYYQFWQAHRMLVFAVALYFLVPTLSCLVRRRDDSTYNKSGVDQFQIWIYRSLRALLLLACLWLAFDPTIGLRQIMEHRFSLSLPLVTFDYLNALGAAFLAGNLLLISQKPVPPDCWPPPKIPWRQLGVPVAAAGLVLIVAGLAGRNAPAIFSVNTHPLPRFGALAAGSLPAGHSVLLSGQAQKLAVIQAALAQHRNGPDCLAVDTRALPLVEYRAWLERQQPAGWLTDETRHPLTPVETTRLLEQVARTNRLFVLQPGYGFLFERFYLEPTGALYEMKLRGEKPLDIPPLSGSLMDENENFWTRVWQKDLVSLVPEPSRRLTGWRKKIHGLGFTPAAPFQDRVLAEWYSLALDSWAVALQQQGRWHEAQLRFEQALQLNANNYSAQISLASNTNLQSGGKLGLAGANTAADQLESLQRMSTVINNFGPVDEPIFCFLLGSALRQSGLRLQAVEQFERTRTLAPGVPAPQLALAELYTQLKLNDRVRPLLNNLRDETKNLPANGNVDLVMALLEADSWLSQTNPANASSALQSVLQQHPDDAEIANRIMNAYLTFGDYASARRLVERQLARSPDDVHALNSQAAILIQSGNAAAALPVLDHILTLTNLAAARLNRASARVVCRDFAGAETDFHELEKNGVEPGRVSYGLALIAEHRHDTNQAVHYLRICLTNTSSGTSYLRQQAGTRLQALEPAPGAK